MKNLKKFATTLALAGIIMMGVSNVKAGLLMSDFMGGNEEPCTSVDGGMILSDLVGIIVNDFTGIIVNDFSSKGCDRVDNGIIVND